jgi:hypothetical protein
MSDAEAIEAVITCWTIGLLFVAFLVGHVLVGRYFKRKEG